MTNIFHIKIIFTFITIRARDGHIMGSGAPYGYRYILKNKDKGIKHGYYEIVEEEARVVRMIFKWVGSGMVC